MDISSGDGGLKGLAYHPRVTREITSFLTRRVSSMAIILRGSLTSWLMSLKENSFFCRFFLKMFNQASTFREIPPLIL